jgi:hypothetical protein
VRASVTSDAHTGSSQADASIWSHAVLDERSHVYCVVVAVVCIALRSSSSSAVCIICSIEMMGAAGEGGA